MRPHMDRALFFSAQTGRPFLFPGCRPGSIIEVPAKGRPPQGIHRQKKRFTGMAKPWMLVISMNHL